MQERFANEGIRLADYAPRVESYAAGMKAGHILNYVARAADGAAVGYSNIFLTSDAHNGEFVAQEDTLYVLPPHRNGLGRAFLRFILSDLQKRGVKRLHATTTTDPRVGKSWERMGFKPIAQVFIYEFEETADVRS